MSIITSKKLQMNNVNKFSKLDNFFSVVNITKLEQETAVNYSFLYCINSFKYRFNAFKNIKEILLKIKKQL